MASKNNLGPDIECVTQKGSGRGVVEYHVPGGLAVCCPLHVGIEAPRGSTIGEGIIGSWNQMCWLPRLVYSFILKFLLGCLSNLCTQPGARTHNREIKSHTVFHLSQPSTPCFIDLLSTYFLHARGAAGIVLADSLFQNHWEAHTAQELQESLRDAVVARLTKCGV